MTSTAKAHLHESPRIMTVPLMILAFFSVVAGYIGLPEVINPEWNWIAHWIEEATHAPTTFFHLSLLTEWLLIGLSVVAVAVGLGLGYFVYHLRDGAPARRFGEGRMGRLSRGGAGFDALYRNVFVQPSEGTADGLQTVDRELVDKGVSGGFVSLGGFSRFVGLLQSGYVRAYALAMFLGIAVLALVVLFEVLV